MAATVVLPETVPFATGAAMETTGGVAVPPTMGGNNSTIEKLYMSPVGEVSFRVTSVPRVDVGAFARCTQYVSPVGDRY